MVIIPYYPIRDEALKQIIRLKLGKIKRRLMENHKIEMTYDDGADRCGGQPLHRSGKRRPQRRQHSDQHAAARRLASAAHADGRGDRITKLQVGVGADGSFVCSWGGQLKGEAKIIYSSGGGGGAGTRTKNPPPKPELLLRLRRRGGGIHYISRGGRKSARGGGERGAPGEIYQQPYNSLYTPETEKVPEHGEHSTCPGADFPGSDAAVGAPCVWRAGRAEDAAVLKAGSGAGGGLARQPESRIVFRCAAPGYRKIVILWVMSAKKEETRARRLAHLIERSASGTRIDLLNPNRR